MSTFEERSRSRGEGAVETVSWGVDGVEYEVDLDADSAQRFRAEMQQYLDASRPVRARRAG
ncbi:Lsr2 dimerization domain-containing protein [Williamsia deligens]|uniref:Histone-like nucleoid-structuring protein Lsr2 n=1 Tax=Williamsia deligens TaxID=321325 RepID=A0ABW3G1R7_9NOCA|nr:histone-like nucleoid-structuring protein Lsr2 [Williamsia deligens]MCP2195073.1 Lsr2 protein [Williamsia deligens]